MSDALAISRERREKINALELEMQKLPQIECPVRSYFLRGSRGKKVYAREITIPEGTVLTGAVHKKSSIVVLSQGSLTISTDNGPVTLHAPYTLDCEAGTKNVAVALTTSVWTNYFDTDETDLDKLVEQLTESKRCELLGGSENKQLIIQRLENSSCHSA